MDIKAYLGLEPGNPKWWGWQKFLTKQGKFDWWKFIKQQMLWHPAESGIPVVLAIANRPPTEWWHWLLVAAAILFIRVVHEFVQFLTMPEPESIIGALCKKDRPAALSDISASGLLYRVNGRHLNAAERACDIFIGGGFCWLYIWAGYWLVQRLT